MMPPASWNGAWTAGIANHLWQSTAVTGIIWLLTLGLRNNHARTRYWLWMIASVKYLIPFSLLIAAGESLHSAFATPIREPAIASVLDQLTLPFPQAATTGGVPVGGTTSQAAMTLAGAGSLVPVILLAVWLCGLLFVVFSWVRGWLRIRASIRSSSRIGLLAQVPVLSSQLSIEPGIFGIFRPVLLLPEGIHNRLTPTQLDAIIAHEMTHVRRRDNLTASIHMVVQAIFWFHPAVWWIKTRLLEEREQACDEVVLQSGNEADVYAESILIVCKICLESPLACVAGVAGSDLKRRILRIMTERVARNLDLSRKLLLALAAIVAVTIPVASGMAHIRQADAHVLAGNSAQNLAGVWQGTLHSGLNLRGVIQISNSDDVGYKGIFYSIDQSGSSFPVSRISVDGANVEIAFADFGAVFEGKLSPDGVSMTGTLTQRTFAHPITFSRATPETAWKIPKPEEPMAADADPSFVNATIKPSNPEDPSRGFALQSGHLAVANITLSDLVSMAYAINSKQIIGAPAWINTDRFDIAAQFNEKGEPNESQLQGMMRKLLAERFKLNLHRDTRELSVYVLSKAAGGQKLTTSAADPKQSPSLLFQAPGKLKVSNGSIQNFTNLMQSVVLDRPVLDRTAIKGRFDFTLSWTPDDSQFPGLGVAISHPTGGEAAPPLPTAIEQQIGLKLEATRAPIEALVIDHLEKPQERN